MLALVLGLLVFSAVVVNSSSIISSIGGAVGVIGDSGVSVFVFWLLDPYLYYMWYCGMCHWKFPLWKALITC